MILDYVGKIVISQMHCVRSFFSLKVVRLAFQSLTSTRVITWQRRIGDEKWMRNDFRFFRETGKHRWMGASLKGYICGEDASQCEERWREWSSHCSIVKTEKGDREDQRGIFGINHSKMFEIFGESVEIYRNSSSPGRYEGCLLCFGNWQPLMTKRQKRCYYRENLSRRGNGINSSTF